MFRWLFLGREAKRFDSPLYIAKSFVGVFAAYAIFSNHPLIGRDMISLLFGMMLTLEPVAMTGFRVAVDQLKATVLGGLVTALLVMLFGVNVVTVPLAVAITVYISLLIDFRQVSPVAIFTAIYMTQYIQLSANGDPSMLLTFRLRMLSLGAGVLIAMIVNVVFSLLFYRRMLHKRTCYLYERSLQLVEALEEGSVPDHVMRDRLIAFFADHDFIKGHLDDLRRFDRQDVEKLAYDRILRALRDLNHLLLDHLMRREEGLERMDREDLHRMGLMMRGYLKGQMEGNLPEDKRLCFVLTIFKENLSKTLVPEKDPQA